MRISIHTTQGDSEVQLDNPSTRISWQSLRTYTFRADSSGRVTLHSSLDVPVLARPVKWMTTALYNDMPAVDYILQPQDGIILVNCQP